MDTELWKAVVSAIEDAIPEYDEVNERISFGRAMKSREYAVDRLGLREGMIVLDAGIGPGTMSQALLAKNSGVTILGLDASTQLLHAAQQRFKLQGNGEVHFVRATFEGIPVRNGAVNRIVSAYAFRDARNRDAAIAEFHRVIGLGGSFAIVDLGKPDNLLKRAFVTTYIQYLMPLFARFFKSNRILGNPWQMIVPTYKLLTTNRELVQAVRRSFSDVGINQFLLGGMIVILAQKDRSGTFS